MNSSYITSAQRAEQLPSLGGVPEIAFIGRSNCGKSSLLNALLGRTGLARTSSTPGRTQMVNFFAVEKGEKKLVLADLPGYGYAESPREVRRHWEGLISAYLTRPEIQEFLFLLDIRRSELGEDDLALLRQLVRRSPKVPVTVVLTKGDKVGGNEATKLKAQCTSALAGAGLAVAKMVAVSSLKKKGIDDMKREVIEARLMP